MATIEFLESRLNGQKAQLEKLEKKLARIYKAKESNWEKNPYYYNESDIKRTLKDIESTNKAIAGYAQEIEQAKEKALSRNVKVILDFLDDWKDRVYQHYKKGLDAYFRDVKECRDVSIMLSKCIYGSSTYKVLEDQLAKLRNILKEKKEGTWENIPKDSPEYRKWYNEKRKVATGEYEWLKSFFCCTDEDTALKALKDRLDQEATAKYDDIIERTNKIVGQITDASHLKIGMKGDLNGYITGTRGKASVQTIGAGGWNIQCAHFRTLIKPLK